MTDKFSITATGYYLAESGKRVNIVNYRVTHDAWEDSNGNPYRENGTPIFNGEKLVSKWSKK